MDRGTSVGAFAEVFASREFGSKLTARRPSKAQHRILRRSERLASILRPRCHLAWNGDSRACPNHETGGGHSILCAFNLPISFRQSLNGSRFRSIDSLRCQDLFGISQRICLSSARMTPSCSRRVNTATVAYNRRRDTLRLMSHLQRSMTPERTLSRIQSSRKSLPKSE